jgi:hypothetical protein
MQRWVIVLGVAAVLTGAKMLAHPAATAPADPASRAALYATAIQAIAPKAVDSAATITGAHAEDKTVVVTVHLESAFPMGLGSADRERMFGALACKQSTISDFVRSGGSFRYDLMRGDGSLYDSVAIARCDPLSPS